MHLDSLSAGNAWSCPHDPIPAHAHPSQRLATRINSTQILPPFRTDLLRPSALLVALSPASNGPYAARSGTTMPLMRHTPSAQRDSVYVACRAARGSAPVRTPPAHADPRVHHERARGAPTPASVALAFKGPLNARLARGVGLSFFLSREMCAHAGKRSARQPPTLPLAPCLAASTPCQHSVLPARPGFRPRARPAARPVRVVQAVTSGCRNGRTSYVSSPQSSQRPPWLCTCVASSTAATAISDGPDALAGPRDSDVT
jgi:hypothetical protein